MEKKSTKKEAVVCDCDYDALIEKNCRIEYMKQKADEYKALLDELYIYHEVEKSVVSLRNILLKRICEVRERNELDDYFNV